MFGSLTPLILGISSIKSGNTIVFYQASRHAVYSTSLTILICKIIKVVASFLLPCRALHRQRQKLDPASISSSSGSDGYSLLRAEDFEVSDPEGEQESSQGRGAGKEASPLSPSRLESAEHTSTTVPAFLWQHIVSQVFQVKGLRLMVPAMIYVVQNNLYLYAASELDPAFLQALWQMRILMSASLSWLVLKKRILPIQWLCILGIFFGVVLVKVATTPSSVTKTAPATSKTLIASLALCAAAVLSSSGGVILEFIFRDRQVNLWASNVQLAGFSILPAAVIVFFRDASHMGPVLHDLHTSPWPISAVLCQSMNGMLIALLLKKAGVIINDFTSAVSIVLTFVIGEVVFPESSKVDSVLDIAFVVAGSIVNLTCSIIYHKNLPEKEHTETDAHAAQAEMNDVHLEASGKESFDSSVPSTSFSSLMPSSVATPQPVSPQAYLFDVGSSDFGKDEKRETEPTLLEMQNLHVPKQAL